MQSTTSATDRAIDSSAARAMWPLPVAREIPITSPRAKGSQWGAPRPVSAGTTNTPPLSSTLRASGSISLACLIIPSPSRSQLTRLPATNTDPSRK